MLVLICLCWFGVHIDGVDVGIAIVGSVEAGAGVGVGNVDIALMLIC